MKGPKRRKRRFGAMIPPWLIIGAVAILAPLFLFMAISDIDRQKEQTSRLLVEKGAALIRSFEAGARTGIGMEWGPFQLQKLLIETAQQPDIDYLIVTDAEGTILADSDPSRIGTPYGLDLDPARVARQETLAWRQVPNSEGADTFEIYRRFAPTREPFPGFLEPLTASPPPPASSPPPDGKTAGLAIFVGLDMGPMLAAQAEDRRRTLWSAALFLLLGFAGIVSLLLAQGYRSASSSLSRIKAFSDSLVENMPIGVAAANGAGELTAFNQTAEAILGLKAADVLGKGAQEVLPGDCREIFRELAVRRRLIEREVACAVSPDRTVPLEVIATTLRAEEDDALVGYVLLFRDMSEMRRLQQEIARSRRLASIGSLAAGVAHEIRNPLSSIKGFATYFRERYRDNAEDAETAEVMIREVDRLNRVITQLLDFARPMTLTRIPIAPQALIRQAVKMIDAQARERGITVTAELPPGIGAAPLDADRIGQVLLNLCLNALAAMAEGGTLRIALAQPEPDWIRIEIADSGSGIPAADLPRVFDPYFTTKPAGTGLGLPIVQKIVEAHGGSIELASEPGKGTTATLLLPARDVGEQTGGEPREPIPQNESGAREVFNNLR